MNILVKSALIVSFFSLQSLVADTHWMHEDYDDKTNSVVVKDVANLMHKLVLKNEGKLESSPYEDIVSVSSISYPPTLRFLIITNFEKYRAGVLEASKADKSKKYDEEKIQKRLYSKKFKLWVKEKTRKNTILQNCTKEEHRYLLNRGIGIDTEYRIKDKGVFLTVEVTLKDCN